MTWSADFLIYPFLFISVYFESFLLITFLSAPTRERRNRVTTNKSPHVAIIVPCWNEEKTLATTAKSLLALEYPKDRLSIVLVNDGSTDNTATTMNFFAKYPQITLINKKENGGKHTALNAGIKAMPNAEFIGCLDADSFVEPNSLREIIACFTKPQVMATTAAMSVHAPHTILQRVQYAEYIFGITTRHILSSVNGIYVTPGPFSVYRANVFRKLGGFTHGHQTEDMEMALRIQRAGYEIENSPRARVYTKAPATLRALIRQRTRWTSGFLRNILGEYRSLIANPKYGALGMFVLPFALLSIIGGITIFLISISEIGYSIFHAISIARGIPISYSLAPHALNWFYLPITGMFFIGSITLFTMLTLIVIGKHLSKTPGGLVANATAYSLLYGFIAPLWLIHSVVDVASGARRTWR